MKRIAAICVAASSVMLGGCASIVSHSHYPVTINSSPDGVRYTVTNTKKGYDVMSGVTPATVSLKASNGFFSKASYMITFEQPGYDSVTFPLKAGIDGWYAGNIILGGLLGILIIDPATGAMWRLDEHVQVSLAPQPQDDIVAPVQLKPVGPVEEESTETSDSVEDGLTLMTIDQVPTEYRDSLVRVN